jgi:NUMOD3 motif
MIDWPIKTLDNKYKRWYEQLVTKAKQKNLPIARRSAKHIPGYSEVHHIVPKCFGGSNNESNLVRFSAREHFVCHWLLTKITTGEDRAKMITAFIMMTGEGGKSGRYDFKITSSRVFEKIRIEYTQYLSEKLTGREISQETRDKISKANTGKSPSAETRAKMSASLKGKPGAVHTPEGKEKIGMRSRGKTYEELYGKERAEAIKEMCKHVGEANGFYGKTHSEETRLKFKAYQDRPDVKQAKSERVKGDKNPAKRPEVKEKISQQQKIRLAKQKELKIGHYDPTLMQHRKELSQGASNGNAKLFEFCDPAGNKYQVKGGFKKFCIEKELIHSSMMRVAKGTKKDYNGWTVKEIK